MPVGKKRKRKPRAGRVNTKKEPKQKVRKAAASSLMCYPLRLLPGAEIKSTLQKFVEVNQLDAAFVLSCVGSVRTCKLRLADSETVSYWFDLTFRFGQLEVTFAVGLFFAAADLQVRFFGRPQVDSQSGQWSK